MVVMQLVVVKAVAVEGGRGDSGGDDDAEEEKLGEGLREDDPGQSDVPGLWLPGALCISRAAYSGKRFGVRCFLGYL